MIRTPPRAVTRFLIPFIDVLILLFCIFLLMPFVSQSPESEGESAGSQSQRELETANRRIAELKAERANLFNHFRLRTLDIDKETGHLYAVGPEGREEIRDAQAAARIIQRERLAGGDRETCFLILYPRELSGFPMSDQVEAYRRWFAEVPFAIETLGRAEPRLR